MSITSLSFAGFVLLVLLVYYLVPRRAQNILLLLASIGFYATWSWLFPLELALLALGMFGLARVIESAGRHRKLLVGVAVLVNLAFLAAFKYTDFFVPSILALLQKMGWTSLGPVVSILMPVGLSYRILENISYVVDVSRGQLPACRSMVDFGLYVFFFPKMLSGPIERARKLLPVLAAPRTVDNDSLARGFTLIVQGAVRKLVIADTLTGAIPAALFQTPLKFGTIPLITGLLSFTFALYNDFAGYTDIVRGVSAWMGIPLSPNFLYPFFSRNFSEIWQRWHITLCDWLRDYIYLPLSRGILRRHPSPRGLLILVVPPMAAMAVSGLWHQINLNMLLWGLWIGVYLVLGRVVGLWRPVVPPDRLPAWRQGLKMIFIFGCFSAALIPFRMELPVAWEFCRALRHIFPLSIPPVLVLLMMGLSLGIDAIQYRWRDEVAFLRLPMAVRSLLLALALLAIFLATRFQSPEPFIYQGF